MKISFIKSLLILSLFASVALADISDAQQQLYNDFKNWTSLHSKNYGVDETPVRFANWQDNYNTVQAHNAKNLSWTLGMNQFADMTGEEFSALRLGYNGGSSMPNMPNFPNMPTFPTNFPNWPFPTTTTTTTSTPTSTHTSTPTSTHTSTPTSTTSTPTTTTTTPTSTPTSTPTAQPSNSDAMIAMLMSITPNATVDWRNQNIVTPIKNQGSCGACWAFSSTGALEGLYALKNDNLLSFSEQQLIDCSSSYGNEGCNGGLFTSSFEYTQASGIELESTYPFTGKSGSCAASSSKVAFTNGGYYAIPANNVTLMKAAVNIQPISVAVEADQNAFQLYSSGIVSANCGTSLDHAILIVGYNTAADGTEYWIVKNQWGTSWGMNGYIEIAIGTQNSGAGVCGINSNTAFPTIQAISN